MPVIIHNQTVFEGEKANITLELESSLVSECSITVQTMDASAIGEYAHGQTFVDTHRFVIVKSSSL